MKEREQSELAREREAERFVLFNNPRGIKERSFLFLRPIAFYVPHEMIDCAARSSIRWQW
jgi:hypothetical protein